MQTTMVDFFFFFDEYGNLRKKKREKNQIDWMKTFTGIEARLRGAAGSSVWP